MRLLKDILNFLTNEMILIIKALFAFIKKQDLLRWRGKTGRRSCEKAYNSGAV